MQEQELKLNVPVAARKAIVAQLKALSAEPRIRLRAMYFDTPDRELARQRAAVRLRLEGRKWVQTFKMAGQDALSRVELNHPRPGPELDLSLYAGTPAEAVFAQVKGELGLRYETDVWRTRRLIRTRLGLVEAAYDEGVVRAGGLELPIHEVEFELMSGRIGALFTLATRWVKQHGLVIDVRSKAERGDGLANAAKRINEAADDKRKLVRDEEIARFWAPAQAGKLDLPPRASPEQALDLITAACVEQIVRNAASLAGVDALPGTIAGPEHVHQLRVGMRRLRSAWRLFNDWTALPEPAVQDAAARYFGEFGAARDSDVLGDTVVPALLRAGMPAISLRAPADAVDANQLAGSPAFQSWLLAVLAWSIGVRPAPAPLLAPMEAAPPAAQPGKLARPVAQRLRKWHRRLIADGRRFHELDDPARHKLRKLAKRLRYGLSFTECLFDAHRVKPYRKRLADLQDVLGDINDLVVARELYAAMTDEHPQAWFALGWIAGRLEELYKDAEDKIALLADVRPFWK